MRHPSLEVSDQVSFGITRINVDLEGAMPSIALHPTATHKAPVKVTLADVQVVDIVMREVVDNELYDGDQYVEEVEDKAMSYS